MTNLRLPLIFVHLILTCFTLATHLVMSETKSTTKIHSVTDISHTFSFYFDGRFASNYIQPIGGIDARNWATLHKCDLSNINLLILQTESSPCPYLSQDIQVVRKFLDGGGGVLILGDHSPFRNENVYPLNEVAKSFGAKFIDHHAKHPLKPTQELEIVDLETYNGKIIDLEDESIWKILIRDAESHIVMAQKPVGKGQVLLASRALAGRQPNAKDPINSGMWQSLLVKLVSGKQIDPTRLPKGTMPENIVNRNELQIQYSDYLEPMSETIFEIYRKSRPFLEQIIGVPPTRGMLKKLILLPTGGGGFSSGVAIGIGVWWGNFPEQRYGMVELLGHEATHSWVLPFAEPMWNEGLATYVGILLGRESGLGKEADAKLENWISKAKRYDPQMKIFDLVNDKEAPHVVKMGKPMWIFEELRKEEPQIISRYFQAKRRMIDPDRQNSYTADDSVAVLSNAVGRNLFDWFLKLNIDVDPSRTRIEFPQ